MPPCVVVLLTTPRPLLYPAQQPLPSLHQVLVPLCVVVRLVATMRSLLDPAKQLLPFPRRRAAR